ncbi:MAG: type II toxin-antitoxin system RelE/ParE family toxin [Candidatus Thermoplasmatota archaeon]|nr:type II toxin-antitoxin system RelE/ParE family toxin [Candidatus Thermoplasmatota archaeon]
MPDYQVKFTEATIRLLEKMEKSDVRRVLDKITLLVPNPFHYVKRLKGVPLYSLRIGKYRVLMSIEKEKLVILVVDIGKRKNVYDDL